MYFFRNYFIPQLCVSLNFAFCYTRISLLQLHEMKTKNCFLLFFVLLIERNRKRGKTFNRQSFSLYWQMWKSGFGSKFCIPSISNIGYFFWQPKWIAAAVKCYKYHGWNHGLFLSLFKFFCLNSIQDLGLKSILHKILGFA